MRYLMSLVRVLIARVFLAQPASPPHGASCVGKPEREVRPQPSAPFASACRFYDRGAPGPVRTLYDGIPLDFPSRESADRFFAARNTELVLYLIGKDPRHYGRRPARPVA